MSDERRRLEEENAALRAELERLRGEKAPDVDRRLAAVIRNAGAPRQPLREWVLEELAVAGVPLYSQYLTAVHICRFDKPLAPSRLGTLAADERKRVAGGRSPDVVLTVGLVADRGTAIKRIWGRSDWPLAERVIAENTGRVLFLRTAIWAFAEAEAGGERWANPAALKLLANQLARDLPVDLRTKRDDFSGWARRAREELNGIEAADRERRDLAAISLERNLNSFELMFGAAGPFTVLPGTKEQVWKDAKK